MKLHTTSSAARAADVPESYVRSLIAQKVITPQRDEGRRAILSEADIKAIKQHRAKRFPTAA